MFRFANIEFLYALMIIPAMVVLYIVAYQIKKRALLKYGDMNIISRLMPDVSPTRPIIKFIIIQVSLALLIVALAGPQFGSKLEEVKRKGVEVVIALDVSNSMLAEDIKPSRLERSKRAISKLIDKFKNDKVGLIVFAGDAYTQLPITTDHRAAKLFLNAVNTGIVPKQGTAIGAAIGLAMNSFSPDNESSKALIIITDGENHEDDAVEKAKEASEQGIIVYTIGMGALQGAPIPIKGSYGQRSFRTDKDGNVVVSKLNETMLSQIAASGNGKYAREDNSQSGFNKILDDIENMEKQEMEGTMYSEYDDQYQYLVGLALLLLLLEFMLLERKNKLFKNVKLFNID